MLFWLIVSLVAAIANTENVRLHSREKPCITHHKKHETGLNFKNHVKCAHNESYCGDWTGRQWNPLNCKYRDITHQEARKCMSGRTLACIGDSQVRDLCTALAYYLMDTTVEESPDHKFDKRDKLYQGNATIMTSFKRWKSQDQAYLGFIYPKAEVQAEKHFDFQIQVWELYANMYFDQDKARHILNNEMPSELAQLRPIDLALWQHGLHDWGWWENPPHGEHFYNSILQQWLRLRGEVKVPSVWVSMNNECEGLIDPHKQVMSPDRISTQVAMVESANVYLKERLKRERLPYFDAASVLRTPQRCQVSGDGLHVKMWVDVVRAKILLNHLCDEENNWVGNITNFM